MKLGVLIAIFGDHAAYRDNLCSAPREEVAHADHEDVDWRETAGEVPTASGPAGWPE
jgi:hypothetical protein